LTPTPNAFIIQMFLSLTSLTTPGRRIIRFLGHLIVLFRQGHVNSRGGRTGSTVASCSEGPGFKSRPGDWLYWLRYSVIFLSLFR
jgi:hypothetical protein